MSANIRLGGLATQLLDVKPRRAMVLHVPRVPDFRESALGVLEVVDVEQKGGFAFSFEDGDNEDDEDDDDDDDATIVAGFPSASQHLRNMLS